MSSQNQNSPVLHVAFYSWFGLSKLTSFLRLANKLAERRHKVSYFLPTNTQPKLAPHNHFPHHLSFIPITVPPVDGLPTGTETTNGIPTSSHPLLMTAMDMTRDTIEAHLAQLQPHVVFYDFNCWMPELAKKHGFKAVHCISTYIARYAYFSPHLKVGNRLQVPNIVSPPPGFPSSFMRMHDHEAEKVVGVLNNQYGVGGLTLAERMGKSFLECDAIVVKSCKEMEGAYCEFFEKMFGKPVLLAGPMVPRTPSSKLDEHLDGWLKGFGTASVVYCALGSQCILQTNQFQEILLGLELTGMCLLRPSQLSAR